MPLCSIVIRAYNEEHNLPRLLAGLEQQTLRDQAEIILVDSGSTDGTLAVASRYPVRVVQIDPQEFSFGRSLNLGISHASGDLIAIASAHVYPVYPDWLERLFAPFSDPQVALTYGKQRGNAHSKFSENQVFAHWYPDDPRPNQSHPFCNNANAAIRRTLWEDHPYDETLSGLEDLAWARWAVDSGHTIAYVPEAEIIHVHDETPRQVYNRYRREAMAFRRIFPEQRFTLWDFVRLYLTNVASDCLHARRQGVLRPNLGSIFWFRLMQFWGTYQGSRQTSELTWQLRQIFYYPRNLRAETHKNNHTSDAINYHDISDSSM